MYNQSGEELDTPCQTCSNHIQQDSCSNHIQQDSLYFEWSPNSSNFFYIFQQLQSRYIPWFRYPLIQIYPFIDPTIPAPKGYTWNVWGSPSISTSRRNAACQALARPQAVRQVVQPTASTWDPASREAFWSFCHYTQRKTPYKRLGNIPYKWRWKM